MIQDSELRRIANDLLRRRTKAFGFESVEIANEIDFDGVPIVVVTAKYSGDPISDYKLLQMVRDEIQTEVWKQGDDRFVFVRDRYPVDDNDNDDDDLEDDGIGASS